MEVPNFISQPAWYQSASPEPLTLKPLSMGSPIPASQMLPFCLYRVAPLAILRGEIFKVLGHVDRWSDPIICRNRDSAHCR